MYQVTYYIRNTPFVATFETLDLAMGYIRVQLENGVYVECRHIEAE